MYNVHYVLLRRFRPSQQSEQSPPEHNEQMLKSDSAKAEQKNGANSQEAEIRLKFLDNETI